MAPNTNGYLLSLVDFYNNFKLQFEIDDTTDTTSIHVIMYNTGAGLLYLLLVPTTKRLLLRTVCCLLHSSTYKREQCNIKMQ